MLTPLQQEFLRRLKHVIRARGLRQTDIAGELAVTASAVSQIMNGKSSLSPERFRKIAEKFAFPPLETCELSHMLQCIKAGAEKYYSLWNRRIFCCRNAQNLSLARLSILSGIPVERLRDLEESFSAQPTADEFLQLRKVFAHLEAPSEAADYAPAAHFVPLFSGEAPPPTRLPLLTLYDCSEYRQGTNLAAFAGTHTRRCCKHTVTSDAKNPVALAASGRDLGFAYQGSLLLILAQTRPAGFIPFLLCCTENGRFFLKNADVRDDELSPFLLDAPIQPEPLPRWELPVLELCFVPVDIRSFGHEFF